MWGIEFIVVCVVATCAILLQAVLTWRLLKLLPQQEAEWQAWCDHDTCQGLRHQDRLNHFEVLFQRSWSYQGLRRIGISAPLLGVCMSALLVWWRLTGMEAGEAVFSTIRLIFLGVLAGAGIALFNQLFQWILQTSFLKRLSKLAVESSSDSPQGVVERFEQELGGVVEHVSAKAELVTTELANEVEKSSRELTTHVSSALSNLGERIDEAATVQESFTTAVDSAREQSEAATAELVEFGNSLKASRQQFPKVTSQFDQLLKETQEVAMSLHGSVQEILEQLGSLNDSSVKVVDGVAQHVEAVQSETNRLSERVSQMSEGMEVFAKSMTTFADQMNSGSKSADAAFQNTSRHLEVGATSVEKAAQEIGHAARQFSGKTMADFDTVVRELTQKYEEQARAASQAATAISEGARALDQASKQSAGTVSKMDATSKSLNAPLRELHEGIRKLTQMSGQQAQMLTAWPDMTEKMLQHFSAETRRAIREVADELAKLVAQLGEVIDGAGRRESNQDGEGNRRPIPR